MKGVIKFGIMFLLTSVVFSLFGTTFTLLFDGLYNSVTYISTGSIGMVLTELVTFIGWLLDLLFLSSDINSYTFATVPTVTVGSISWALSIFRLFLGLSIFILILSLIFGKGGTQ